MKKLMRKLVLSCFALGLAVVTLTTTTFAWWTANTEVSATGIQGTTAGEVSGSLEIKQLNDPTWGPTVVIDEYTSAGNDMQPLQYSEGAWYFLKAEEADYLGDAADEGQYIQFDVYLRMSTAAPADNTKVYLKNLNITNTFQYNDGTGNANGLPSKKVLVDKNNGLGNFELGADYKVNAVRALNMNTVAYDTATRTEEDGKTTITYSDVAGTNSGNISVGEYCIQGADSTQESLPATGVDAIKYFNTVMNLKDASAIETPYTTEIEMKEFVYDEHLTHAIEVATLAGSEAVKVTITVWLDGWDQYCFDACQGQSFNIYLSFTTDGSLCEVGK